MKGIAEVKIEMTTYVEKVQAGAAVDTRGLVSSIDDSALANLAGLLANTSGIRLQDGGKVQLQALDELVLKLNVGDEVVGIVPSLSEGQAIGTVGVFSLS